jgi:hypothetical protein
LRNLYESSNYLTTVTPTGVCCGVSALAYGGSKDGHARWEVAYGGGTGALIWVRLPNSPTSAGITSNYETINSGVHQIRDVVIDPNDYTVAYAATDIGVFRRSAGSAAGVGTWTKITKSLFDGSFQFQSLAYIPGPTPAETALLAGSQLGIFRITDPNHARADVAWTQLGRNLPNALISDLDYISVDPSKFDARRTLTNSDDLLLVGTLGRGAWTLSAASVAATQVPILKITGQATGTTVTLSRNPFDQSLLDVTIGPLGAAHFSAPILSIFQVEFDGQDGVKDTLIVDSTYGTLSFPGGILFKGGTGGDDLVLKGEKVYGIPSTPSSSVDNHDGTFDNTYSIDDVTGGGTEKITFASFLAGTDNVVTTDLHTASVWEKAVDGLMRSMRATPGANTELAVLGRALPGVISGAVRTPTEAIEHNIGPGEESGEEEITAGGADGFSRLLEFANGTTLRDLIANGTITSTADLLAQLQNLPGVTSVTNTGTDTEPRIVLNLTKTLEGSSAISATFDKFGGHVELRGFADVSVDVQLNVVFGIDSDGNFYLETNGSSPEFVASNIQVTGSLEGEGQLGILEIKLDDAAVSINGVSVTVDLATAGDRLYLADLNPATLEDKAAITATGGPGDDAVLTGHVAASAAIPGLDDIDIGEGTLTVTWADISDPLTVQASFTGGLDDYLKVRAEELHELLVKVRDATELLSQYAPASFQGGLDKVIAVISTFDKLVVDATSDVSGSVSFETIQDLMARISRELNQELAQFGLRLDGSVLTWDFALDSLGLDELQFGVTGFQSTLANLHFTFAVDLSKLVSIGGGSTFSIAHAFSLEIRGDVSDIDVLNLLTGGAGFAVTHRFVDADVDGGGFNAAGGVDLHDAELTTFGLDLDEAAPTDPETRFLQVGTDDVGLRLEDGKLAVAALSPADGADTRRWDAIKATGLTGHLSLGPLASATVTGADIAINLASGGATPLDWTAALDINQDGTFHDALVVDTSPTTSLTIDFTTELVDVSGNLDSISIADGFVTGTAHFSIK